MSSPDRRESALKGLGRSERRHSEGADSLNVRRKPRHVVNCDSESG